jgi:hypothetical protein
MVEAIRSAAAAAERRADFVSEAVSAREALMKTSAGYRAEDVHAYLRARTRGESTPKPKARTWRS